MPLYGEKNVSVHVVKQDEEYVRWRKKNKTNIRMSKKNNKTWIYLKRISKKFDKYIKDKKEKKYKKIEARVLKNV